MSDVVVDGIRKYDEQDRAYEIIQEYFQSLVQCGKNLVKYKVDVMLIFRIVMKDYFCVQSIYQISAKSMVAAHASSNVNEKVNVLCFAFNSYTPFSS